MIERSDYRKFCELFYTNYIYYIKTIILRIKIIKNGSSIFKIFRDNSMTNPFKNHLWIYKYLEILYAHFVQYFVEFQLSVKVWDRGRDGYNRIEIDNRIYMYIKDNIDIIIDRRY